MDVFGVLVIALLTSGSAQAQSFCERLTTLVKAVPSDFRQLRGKLVSASDGPGRRYEADLPLVTEGDCSVSEFPGGGATYSCVWHTGDAVTRADALVKEAEGCLAAAAERRAVLPLTGQTDRTDWMIRTHIGEQDAVVYVSGIETFTLRPDPPDRRLVLLVTRARN